MLAQRVSFILWAFAASLLSRESSSAAARPVIISTDPGIDDSIALLLAVASPEIDLRAVCINFGSLHNTSQLALNVLSVLALAGRDDIPVHIGAQDPLNGEFHELGGPLFHGQDGLGGVQLPPPQERVNTRQTGSELIVDACRNWNPKPVLISLSPLTSIAVALALEPRLPMLCPDLYLMGGTVLAAGNTSPLAEANFANDADAAKKVFAAGFNVYIAGLDVTMATWLDNSYLEELNSLTNRVGQFVWNITRFYTRAYNEQAGYEVGGMPLHDPSAVMMFLRPSLYSFQRWPAIIDAAPYPSVTRGIVVADRRGGPLSPPPPENVTLHFAMGVDAVGVRELLHSRIAMLPSAKAADHHSIFSL